MALFPAFAEAANNKVEDSSKELDWLNNKSFQTGDAISLHSRFLEKTGEKANQKGSRDVGSGQEEEREVGDVPPRKKKKKSEKKRKKKKKHKRSERNSSSSGSDSDTVYPSDLIKKEEEEDRQQDTSLASCFSWLDDLQAPTGHPFCVDRKPDPANWTYKSLYRGDVARYRRKGSSTLGLDSQRQGVSWEDSETKKRQKGGDSKKTADRYFSKASRQLLKSEPPLPVSPAAPDALQLTSFLPVGDVDEKNKRQESGDRFPTLSVNPLGVYDSSTALWLQGKGQQDDQKLDLETEGNPVSVVGRTGEFNRRLREQPSDTQLWLQFIRYQDEVSSVAFEEEQGGESAEHRKSSYRAILDKKLSIAERAVATNPSCIALQLERLRICQELWEPLALAKEWKKLENVFFHDQLDRMLSAVNSNSLALKNSPAPTTADVLLSPSNSYQ